MQLAMELGLAPERIAVVENGTVIEFHNAEMKIGERIPGGYVFIDGSGVGDVGPAVMREREALSRDGFVAVYLKLDPKSGRLVNEPEIISKGFVFIHEADQLFDEARKRIREVVAKTEKDSVRNRVERDLSKFFYNETRRRPVIIVFA
jgi:ribonuclease J